jgi:hypothetical protein
MPQERRQGEAERPEPAELEHVAAAGVFGTEESKHGILLNTWPLLARRARQRGGLVSAAGYLSNSMIGLCSSTPVSRWSRPWNLYVNLPWSIPRQCRMVAFRSFTWAGFSATL